MEDMILIMLISLTFMFGYWAVGRIFRLRDRLRRNEGFRTGRKKAQKRQTRRRKCRICDILTEKAESGKHGKTR